MILSTEDVLTAFWRAFNAHDVDALLSLLDDDVVLSAPATPEPIVGKQRVGAAWYLTFTFVSPNLTKEVVWTSIGERSGACEVVERGTLQLPPDIYRGPDGRALEPRAYELNMAAHFNLNESGQISRIASYWDTASLARQVGLDVDTIFDIQRKAVGLQG